MKNGSTVDAQAAYMAVGNTNTRPPGGLQLDQI